MSDDFAELDAIMSNFGSDEHRFGAPAQPAQETAPKKVYAGVRF